MKKCNNTYTIKGNVYCQKSSNELMFNLFLVFILTNNPKVTFHS